MFKFYFKHTIHWNVQVQLDEMNAFRPISKTKQSRVVKKMMHISVTPRIKLKFIVDRKMVQMLLPQQLFEKEQSGHQTDVMVQKLHVNMGFGIKFPIVEVVLNFFICYQRY